MRPGRAVKARCSLSRNKWTPRARVGCILRIGRVYLTDGVGPEVAREGATMFRQLCVTIFRMCLVLGMSSGCRAVNHSPLGVLFVAHEESDEFALLISRFPKLKDGMDHEEVEAVLKVDLEQWEKGSEKYSIYYWKKLKSRHWVYIYFYDSKIDGGGFYKITIFFRGKGEEREGSSGSHDHGDVPSSGLAE